MLVSLALFGAGSALCAAAPSSGAFIAARALLGLAGAGVIVMALSALTVLFSERERPKAVGVWASANFVALPIGPILGGWLLTHAWWGWVFLLNVPVAALGLLAAWRLIPESRAPRRPGFDLVGTVASVGGLVALTFGLIEAGQHGWANPGALGAIAAGILALAGFAGWERRLDRRPGGEPLIDPRLFASPSFMWGVILICVLVVAMVGVIFTLPQYFQGVAGTDALGSGLRLLPLIGGLVAAALPADAVARAIGAKRTAAIGFAVLAAGLAASTTIRVGTGSAPVAAFMVLIGAGVGLAMATCTSAALATLSEADSGIGSAVLQALNKTAAPLGTAVLGSVLSAGYLARLQTAGLPVAAARLARASIFGAAAVARAAHAPALLDTARIAFVHGMDEALLVCALVSAGGVLLALRFLPGTRRRRSVQDAADGDSSFTVPAGG
jgi:predicted MFS family arabinose efflux permease